MLKILIDGYNLLPQTDYSNREDLISALIKYRKIRSHTVTIVFDGTYGGTGSGTQMMSGGIEIIFSPLTLQADDTIEELLATGKYRNHLVVSSDRRLQKAAVNAEATYAESIEFSRKLNQALREAPQEGKISTPPWLEGREDEDALYGQSTKGKRKQSKKERNRQKILKKL